MHKGTFSIITRQRLEFVDITDLVQRILMEAGLREGICHLYNPHTTAGITINEGADPDVQTDVLTALQRIVPIDVTYRHAEGNSPAHVMAALMGCHAAVFIENGRLDLGTWQRIFFCEFDGPRSRKMKWRWSGA